MWLFVLKAFVLMQTNFLSCSLEGEELSVIFFNEDLIIFNHGSEQME